MTELRNTPPVAFAPAGRTSVDAFHVPPVDLVLYAGAFALLGAAALVLFGIRFPH